MGDRERTLLEATALRHLLRRNPADIADAPFVDLAPLAALLSAQYRLVGDPYGLEEGSALLRTLVNDQKHRRVLSLLTEAGAIETFSQVVSIDEGQKAVEELKATLSDAMASRQADALRLAALELAEAIKLNDTHKMSRARDLIQDLSAPRLATERTVTPSLAHIIQVHDSLTRSQKPCSPTEGVRFRADRGYWASWLNAHLGARGALEPGRNLLAGAAPGAGKTSVAAALADDAIHAQCAVHWVQLELGLKDTLEHMLAQHMPADARTAHLARTSLAERLPKPDDLVQCYGKLLSYDQTPLLARKDFRHVVDEVRGLARRVRTLRKRGDHQNACNGVLIVDYVQRLVDPELGAQRGSYEAIAGACSIIQEAASEEGVALVLLSQVTKSSQRDSVAGDAGAFKGIDTNFADCAVAIHRAQIEDTAWIPCADRTEIANYERFGEARLLSSLKTRGTCPSVPGYHGRLTPQILAWFLERMLWGDDDWTGSQRLISSLGVSAKSTIREPAVARKIPITRDVDPLVSPENQEVHNRF